MKRNITYLISIVVSLTMLLSSCELQRTPKDSLSAEQSLNDFADAQAWNAGFLSGLRTITRGANDMLQDVQADQLNPSITYGNYMSGAYNWTSFSASDMHLSEVYSSYYERIRNINFALPKIEEVKITDKDPDMKAMNEHILNGILGTAHFAKAYYYQNLAIRFGRPYKAASADTDLCVPLIVESPGDPQPPRATNRQVYDQIFADIAQAKKYLANHPGMPMADEVTLDAVKALEARTYFYMEDYAKAYATAKELTDAGTYLLSAPDPMSFMQMWQASSSSEEILQMSIERTTETPDILNYYGPVQAKEGVFLNQPDFLPTQWMVDLYSDKDLRKAVYFEDQRFFYINMEYPVTVISKFKGDMVYAIHVGPEFEHWGGYFPTGESKPKIFRIAEMYLIVAESAYETGNESDALKYINALKVSRGLDEISLSGTALRDAIREERTRELAYEGFRLWDLRRWGLPVERHDVQKLPEGNSPFLAPVTTHTLSIPAGHDKFVWGIPQNDLNTNSTIETQQNKGW